MKKSKEDENILKKRVKLAKHRLLLAANGPEAEEVIRQALQGGIAVESMLVQPNRTIAM